MADNEPREVLFEVFGTKVKTMTVVYLLFILFGGWLIMGWFFSVDIPGHWNEKGDYETKVYVNLFKDKGNSKNYRVVGDIRRTSDCDEDACYSSYYLDKATFPQTGFTEFEDCEVELEKKNYCTDNDGEEWYVEMTNQKPK